jgi:Protein of unknown function (DUF3253)
VKKYPKGQMVVKEGSNSLADSTLKAEILRSLQHRDRALSVSPSEIARSLADDKAWRPLMPRIRSLLVQLVREQRVIVTRGTQVLSAQEIEGGTIRIRRGPQFD